MFEDPLEPVITENYTLIAAPNQERFIKAVVQSAHEPMYSILAMGGGVRGMKTFSSLMALTILCKMFPGSRWAVVREDLTTLKKHIIPAMNKIVMASNGFINKLHQGTWSYTCKNGSEILLWAESFAIDKDLERWKGLEVNGFLLEEASGLNEKSFYKAVERAGAYIIPDPERAGKPAKKQPRPLVLVTFNPCFNWPKEKFYDPYMSGTMPKHMFYLPSTIADNPHASEAYKDNLKHLPPAEYKRFVQGDWTQSDDPDQLIKFEWIIKARSIEHVPGQKRLGWDVARYGDDETIGTVTSGNGLVCVDSMKNVDTNTQAKYIASQYVFAPEIDMRYVPQQNVRIDVIGVGAGTVDSLRNSPYNLNIKAINSAARPVPRHTKNKKGETVLNFYKYKNLRAQMHWEFREKMRLGQFYLPEHLPAKLVADLLSIKYSIHADKEIYIASKQQIKATLGRSNDYSDSLIMSAFDLPEATAKRKITPSYSQFTG